MIDRLLLDCLTRHHWSLHEPVLRDLSHVLLRHATGTKLTAVQINEVVEARDRQADRRADSRRSAREAVLSNHPSSIGGARQLLADDRWAIDVIESVAILPITGVIAKRADMVNGCSQERGTSCEQIEACLRAVADAYDGGGVDSLLLDIDSPGGMVDGVADTADLIYELARSMPVVAHADGCMCSAAYWLGCQAGDLYCSQTAVVGSIGVYHVVADLSRYFDEELKTTLHIVKAGDKKAIGVPGTAISEDDLAEVQRGVDSIYDIFVAAVSRGRECSAERAGMLADGRVHIGTDAVELGLADEVQSFNQTLEAMIEDTRTPEAALRLAV